MLKQFLKNCSPREGLALEEFMEHCLLRRGSMLEQGKSVRSPPTKEEELEEATCIELTTAPVPQPGAKLSPGRKGSWGKGFLKIWFYLPLSYSDLI